MCGVSMNYLYLIDGHSIYKRHQRFLDIENPSDSEQELIDY